MIIKDYKVDIKNYINEVADFPQKGVGFKDISPLLSNTEVLTYISENLFPAELVSCVDFIVGLESRGFLFGMLLAAKHNKGFIPIRKAGKLPPPCESITYSLEYGQATFEMKKNNSLQEAPKVLIVDDVLATGGTLQAAIDLSIKCGYRIKGVGVVIDLEFLNNFKFNNEKVYSLAKY